jgi:hypothetical protein
VTRVTFLLCMMWQPNGFCQASGRELTSWSNLSILLITRTSQLIFIPQ